MGKTSGMNLNFRATLSFAALAAALVLAACSSAPPTPPPPPPPPPPPVTLGPQLLQQASAYRYYVDRAAAITPDFADGAAIARSLQTGVAYEPSQMLRGAIAYGAVAALQDPAFVAGVKTYAVNADQRRQIAYAIMRDPAYVVGMPGSASAAGLVSKALADDGQKLYAAGKAVKQSAYDIQKQPWSKAEVPDRESRLVQAKTLSSTPVVGDLAETAHLQRASIGAEPLGLDATPIGPPYSPTVIRGLAVAALAILGEATDTNMPTIMAVMAEPNIGMCANMSKLNLYQCLAVSKPHYEDVFCLGQHAMMDTGRCLIKASGQQEPFEPKFIPVIDDSKGYHAPRKATKRKGARKG